MKSAIWVLVLVGLHPAILKRLRALLDGPFPRGGVLAVACTAATLRAAATTGKRRPAKASSFPSRDELPKVLTQGAPAGRIHVATSLR